MLNKTCIITVVAYDKHQLFNMSFRSWVSKSTLDCGAHTIINSEYFCFPLSYFLYFLVTVASYATPPNHLSPIKSDVRLRSKVTSQGKLERIFFSGKTNYILTLHLTTFIQIPIFALCLNLVLTKLY